MPAPAAAATRRGIHALHALAVLYVAAAVAAMAWLSPRVPYADAWRHLGRYLALPFPRDVLAPDNGHQEILPNLVRVAELRLFEGGQWLQIAVGIALALLTLATCWRALRGLEPARRAAAWLGAVLGVCWLGNIRALAHANESVHAYSVTLLVAIGLLALARARPADVLARTALAAACGLGAAFSFGSGIAAFAAFAAVLLLRRAHWREWAVLLAGLATTLVLVQWNGGGTPSPEWAPLRQLDLSLRWLAGPFVYAAWPVLDPAIATHVPLAAVRVPALAIANAYEGAAGPVMLARWPHLGLGLAGLGGLGALAWKTWRQPGPAALFGLGLSCFAAAVGGLIAIVRLDYFAIWPDQLLAPRYLVWSSLFWAGLLIAGAAHARKPARIAVLAGAIACLLLPSQVWMARMAVHTGVVATQGAVAAAVGVLPPGLPLGETVAEEVAATLPRAQAARVAVYAWPEAQWLGQRPPAPRVHALDAQALQVREVGNRIGARGRELHFVLADAPAARLLLLDADGVARGLATQDPAAGDAAWIGWMRGTGMVPPRVVVVR